MTPTLENNVEGNIISEQLKAAREAGNTWFLKEKELEMFVARGYMESATDILNPSTKEPTGAFLIHQYQWTDGKPFIAREGAFKTSLARVGRATKQKVKTTQSIPVNAKLYSSIIKSGIIRRMKDGEPVDTPKTREEMLEFARLYPESASEAIDVWLESPKFKVIDSYDDDDFKWIFTHLPVKTVLMYIGEEENPVVAGVFTFNSPSTEERDQFEDEVRNLDTDKKGEMNFAELSENFKAKVSFGLKHFKSVEGIAFQEEGKRFESDSIKDKEQFVILFNPIWFVEAVETMLDSFTFTKGKSKTA